MIFRKSKLDAFLVLYAAIAFVNPFLIALYITSLWFWLLLIPLQVLLLVVVMNTSMHHHMHVPIFRSNKLNRLYELFVSATVGIPFQMWKWFHATHHRYNNDKLIDGKTYDPVSFYRFGKHGQRENFWSYCIKGVYRDLTGYTLKDPHNTCHSKISVQDKNKVTVENACFVGYLILLFVVNFKYGILFVGIYLLALAANHANSYGEHFNATEPTNFRANAVGCYNKLYNWLCFNSGYHQEHHVRPSAHWTELPSITKTLPKSRHTINTMFMFNGPLLQDVKSLLGTRK